MKSPCSSLTTEEPRATSCAFRKSPLSDSTTDCGSISTPSYPPALMQLGLFRTRSNREVIRQTDKVIRNETPSMSSVKPAIMKPAAACDCYPRQHRYDLLGAACRLATAALLPTLAHGTLSLGYELDCFIQEPEGREIQAQKLTQPIHRQFTSLYRRRCCWLAGLVPLTCHYYTSLCLQCQTFVRMFDKCEPCTVLGKHGNQANCFGHAEEPFSTSRKAA